ncbi:MAG: hypothetical protein IKZ60_06135 [Bacteroidales bacterium]|nr:hypothetical protein [Bacteroidales bacterium]
MKKYYLSPFVESVKMNPMSVLMTSPGGSLDDLGETPIITDSIVDQDDFGGLLF